MADANRSLPPLDGTLLEAPLEDVAPSPVLTDDVEDRLGTVADHVARGAYGPASREAEALLREGVRDIRLLGPYLFAVFLERELKGLPGIFRSLTTTLTRNWEAFGPVEKRGLLADNALRWLLKTLSKHLQHHEKLKDERWKRWCEPSNREPVEEALALAPQVFAAFAEGLKGEGSENALRALMVWLQEHLRAIPAASAAAAKAAPEKEAPEPEEEDDDAPEEDEDEAPAASSPVGAAPRAPAPTSGPVLPVSPAMALLLRKLSAFDVLVERQDFLKAGIVAADVLGTIERFDPRVYLPMLFARFFAGLSTHAETLEPLLHNTESLAFRSLDQLYRVDLEAFLAQQAGGEE